MSRLPAAVRCVMFTSRFEAVPFPKVVSMRILYGVVGLAAGITLCPVAARAQQSSPVLFADNSAALVAPAVASARPGSFALAQDPYDKPDEQMGTSGFFLGMVGMLAGAAIGSQIGQGSCPTREEDKDCVNRHAYTGALVAGTVLVPVGVHLGNKSRGNFWLSLAASAAEGTALYYGFKAVPGSPVAMAPFLAAPIQVFTSVKIEKRK
jgi:hypothetical protein